MYSYGSCQFIACQPQIHPFCLICENATDPSNVLPLAADTILSFIGRERWRNILRGTPRNTAFPTAGHQLFSLALDSGWGDVARSHWQCRPTSSLGCFPQAFLKPHNWCRGLVAKSCPTLAWTAALQALLSMEFPRQEHWSGLPFPVCRHMHTDICIYIHAHTCC